MSSASQQVLVRAVLEAGGHEETATALELKPAAAKFYEKLKARFVDTESASGTPYVVVEKPGELLPTLLYVLLHDDGSNKLGLFVAHRTDLSSSSGLVRKNTAFLSLFFKSSAVVRVIAPDADGKENDKEMMAQWSFASPVGQTMMYSAMLSTPEERSETYLTDELGPYFQPDWAGEAEAHHPALRAGPRRARRSR